MESEEIIHIIKGCVNKDKKYQTQLYNKFKDELYQVCIYYSKNRILADDNFQDGFIKIFVKIEQYKFSGSFVGWMKTIMRNTCLMEFKTKYNQINKANIDNLEIEDNNYYDKFTYNEIQKLISELSEKHRNVFILVMQGNSHKDVSDKLKISISDSKVNYCRARKILREQIIKLNLEK